MVAIARLERQLHLHVRHAQRDALAVVLDVHDVDAVLRQVPEQDETVPGALRIPYRDLADADLSALDPERPVATVCNSGVRASVAASQLARRGFRDVRPVLEGGMPAYLAGAATPAAR